MRDEYVGQGQRVANPQSEALAELFQLLGCRIELFGCLREREFPCRVRRMNWRHPFSFSGGETARAWRLFWCDRGVAELCAAEGGRVVASDQMDERRIAKGTPPRTDNQPAVTRRQHLLQALGVPWAPRTLARGPRPQPGARLQPQRLRPFGRCMAGFMRHGETDKARARSTALIGLGRGAAER